MILYSYEKGNKLLNENDITNWILAAIEYENKKIGDINYIFCGDNYLYDLNVKHLKHSVLTDIISFDYTLGELISGDIFISVDRVKENADKFKVSFQNELHRVMIHGILHLCGYNDKTEEEKQLMRQKEDYYLSLRTF